MPTEPAPEHVETLIVGAGVAGALTAVKLAKAGHRVLVLEAGPERTSRADRVEMVGAFASTPVKTPSAPYRGTPADRYAPAPQVTDGDDGYYERADGSLPFKSTYQRLAGGSTWHWLGNAPRSLPNDFRLHETYGVGDDWPLSYDDLEPWYATAEAELGVSGEHREWDGLFDASRSTPFPMPPIWRTYSDEVVAPKLEGKRFGGVEVQVRTTPQARNSTFYQGRPPCAGNSSCVPICPIAAKYDATVHIELARNLPDPAEFRFRSVVHRLLFDTETGRVTGAEYDQWSADGTRREQRSVRCDRVVVAAHAIETPMLLLKSGLAAHSPVGQYLMDHPQGYGGAVLPEPVYGFRGPPVVTGIDAFRDGPFRAERAAFRISLGNDGWGRMLPLDQVVSEALATDDLLGADLRRSINDRAIRLFRMSFSSEMLPVATNRVELGSPDETGQPRPRITFTIDDYSTATFEYATAVLSEMFDALGVTESKFSYPDSLFSGAGHIMGTCRMGRSTTDSVVDHTGRAHEHENLVVVGSSTFPTGGTANPTLTMAALTLRTADLIARGDIA